MKNETLYPLEKAYETLKDFAEVYVECSETPDELRIHVEQTLRDLECNRVEFQNLTDTEWEDMLQSVWEDLCDTYEEQWEEN